MPLFEYQCRDCAHRFERLHSYTSRAPRCPECDGRSTRQFSAPAIRFKGSGFYINDYASKKQGSDDGKSDAAEAKDKSTKSGADAKSGKDDKKAKPTDGAKKSAKPSTGKSGGSSSDS